MSPHHKPRAFWRLARIWFRHVRITVWLLILLVLVILIYLHNIGLPGFAQRAVVRAFEAKGVRLELSRIHLVWFRTIEANDVSLRPVGSGWVPSIECRKLELHFDPGALLRLRIVPEDLAIDDGQLVLPYPDTNGVTGRLTATNLQAYIRFEPEGHWSLGSLKGVLAGCTVSASGTIANAGLIQDWRVLRQRADHSRGSAHEIWKRASQIRNEIHFLTPPLLRIGFDVDGAKPEALALWFSLAADSANSPWGLLKNPDVFARLQPVEDSRCSEVEFVAQADQLSNEFGRGEHLTLSCTFSCLAESGSVLAGRAAISASQLDTVWAGAVDLDASLGWRGDGTNLLPALAELDVKAASLSTRMGLAHGVNLQLAMAPSHADHRRVLELPRFLFADLDPYDLSAEVRMDELETSHFAATNLVLEAAWSAPSLEITNLSVDWAGGHLDARAGYDAISGRVNSSVASDFDPQRFYSLLPRAAVVWLQQFTWQQPPVVQGSLGLTLPEWAPGQLLWPGDLRPSLYLNGRFDIGQGTFKRIPLSGASSRFTYSNMCWHLPDLTVRRPEGSLRLEHRNNDRTREFVWRADGAVDPTPAIVLVPEHATETREVLGTLHFGGPPEVHLAVAGCWSDPASIHAHGTGHATNFAFRGCAFDELKAQVGYTNQTLTISQPEVRTALGVARAASLVFDFSRQLAFLSNGVSSVAPMTVATVIGPQVVKAIAPYRFLNPPDGRVEGVIPLRGVAGADMRFDLKGGPFSWQDFNLEEIEARVLWRDETVALSNVQAEFYGGRASGEAFFDFTGKTDADFWFNLSVTNADIQPLVIDVFQSTNRLEGRLSGVLSVTQANTGDFGSWFGYGHARLEEGYIWNVPVFGVLSPVLDVLVPGLGRSRAREAEGRYGITNSVIRTDDLVIHTSNLRLLYSGTVDFQGQVDAVAEAEILRDTVLVGQLVSVVLTPLSKAMIIEITGTLAHPKARPLYLLPRIFLAPMNPVKMFKDIFAPPEPQYQDWIPGPGTELPPPAPGGGTPP